MKELKSINKTPRTTAACINNLKRCLNFLRTSKSRVAINELYLEQAVLQGSPLAIYSVFEQIYKAYPLNIKKLQTKV